MTDNAKLSPESARKWLNRPEHNIGLPMHGFTDCREGHIVRPNCPRCGIEIALAAYAGARTAELQKQLGYTQNLYQKAVEQNISLERERDEAIANAAWKTHCEADVASLEASNKEYAGWLEKMRKRAEAAEASLAQAQKELAEKPSTGDIPIPPESDAESLLQPHGPVSEKFMRSQYGASGYISKEEQLAQAQKERDEARANGPFTNTGKPLLGDVAQARREGMLEAAKKLDDMSREATCACYIRAAAAIRRAAEEKVMSNPKIAVLAGTRREFDDYARGSKEFVFVDQEFKLRGWKPERLIVIGTFWQRPKAKELLDVAQYITGRAAEEGKWSFMEMEIRATVALDGDTRRACNNENCSREYGHKGECQPEPDAPKLSDFADHANTRIYSPESPEEK